MIKKYHVSAQYGNTWNPKSYAKFISGTQTYNKFPITLRTTQQSIPTWSVKGNMVQNGVPSSTTPITPQETGERTGNLFDLSAYYSVDSGITDITINGSSLTYNVSGNLRAIRYRFDLNPSDVYTISLGNNSSKVRLELRYLKDGTQVGNTIIIAIGESRTITGSSSYDQFLIYISNGSNTGECIADEIMLNTGLTALPYQPHGYKLDIKSGSTTIPVYLGQVQSTRKIKKLVLTGRETWSNYGVPAGGIILSLAVTDFLKQAIVICACSHYPCNANISNANYMQYGVCFFINKNYLFMQDPAFRNQTDFTNYIAQQYDAGTPVTVWYVLANETTGVVNEPLRKIGDYVDSITNPVPLPTTPGINTIDVNTTLKPSEMSLTYNGYKVCKSTKIQQVTREVDFVNNTKSLTGSVDNLKVYQLMNRCNVSNNGTITAYYGDPNYTEDGSNGQVMVYVKKFYYKLDVSRTGDLDGINIRKGRWSISDIPIEGHKLHPAFLAADGVTEIDYFLYGAFEALGEDSNGTYNSSYNTTAYKLASIGGNTYAPIQSLTRATARTMASNRGNGWYCAGIKQTMAIQMLLGVEYGFNSQNAIGNGISGASSVTKVGTTVGNTTSGTTANKTTAVNYRGIENFWGNIYALIDGMNLRNRKAYVCNTLNFVDDTSTGYTEIGFTLATNHYITYFGYDQNNDWVLLPSASSSSRQPNNAIGDYIDSGSGTNWHVSPHGGYFAGDVDCGVFTWDCWITSSSAGGGIGARLMYIPQTT